MNPLLSVLVYAIVFPYIMRVQTPNYLLFLISGIIPYNWFTTVVSQSSGIFVYNSNIIKKVYFPREILPISAVTSGLVNFLISCIIILLFAIFGGVGISWHLVFLPFLALIQYVFTLGVSFILSALNVYIRDVEYIVSFVLQMLFYATPILYTVDMFHGWILWIFRINPMTHLINAYRDIFYVHQVPRLGTLSILFVICIVFLIISYKIFKKMEKGFAEEL